MLRLQEREVEKERTAVVEASSSPLQATRSLASMMEPIRYVSRKDLRFLQSGSTLKELDKEKDFYIKNWLRIGSKTIDPWQRYSYSKFDFPYTEYGSRP
jgi:hypothetical protein